MPTPPAANLQQRFQTALTYLKQGQPAAAKPHFEALAKQLPKHAEVLHYLGLCDLQLGLVESAEKHLRRAIKFAPGYWQAHNNLAVVLKTGGKRDKARDVLVRLVAQQPDYIDAHSNLGVLLCEMGETETALPHLQTALKAQPQHADANNAMGVVLRQRGKIDAAIRHFHVAITSHPKHAEALNNLGVSYMQTGDNASAVRYFQQSLAINPNNGEALCNLGTVWQNQGELAQARQCFSQALALHPDNGDFLYKLGWNYHEHCEHDQARHYYEQALQAAPGHLDAHSNLLLLNNYDPAVTPQAAFALHQQWQQRFERKHKNVKPASFGANANADPQHPVRIAYVSPDFRRHSVAYFFEPLLRHHNRDQFHITLYYNNRVADEVTHSMRDLADQWRDIADLSDREVQQQIRDDQISILIDLAGHTALNRLPVFARRAAPIQVNWLGYPNTSGLRNMDYRISDHFADPVGESDALCTEQLIRLEGGFLSYHNDLGDALAHHAADDEQATKGSITFGSFNALPKVTSEVIDTWAEILQGVPNAKLLLKSRQFADATILQRFTSAFEARGIAAERLQLLATVPSTEEHLALYANIDIALDPFPYNGTTTTFEALWMGVPVLCLKGHTHAGRVGESILQHAGLADWIADDRECYVKKAIGMATQRETLQTLRRTLRQRLQSSSLCDHAGFAQKFEAALKALL